MHSDLECGVLRDESLSRAEVRCEQLFAKGWFIQLTTFPIKGSGSICAPLQIYLPTPEPLTEAVNGKDDLQPNPDGDTLEALDMESTRQFVCLWRKEVHRAQWPSCL